MLNLTGPRCGDGILNGAEVCDDGNATTETSCPYGSPTCTRCNATCTATLSLNGAYCGDGTQNGTETCDDGNNTTESACPYGTASCTKCDASCSTTLNLSGPTCGDGTVNGPEVCDDGNVTTETSCPYGTPTCARCNATCTTALNLTGPFCGDRVLNGTETCDDGNNNACGTCNATCSQNRLTAATGRITIVSFSQISANTFTISDGINPAVVFEYDRDGSVVGANKPINVSAANSNNSYAVATAAAINGVGAELGITAVVSAANVDLTNDVAGARGNQTILTNAQTSRLTVSGMSGGGGFDCAVGTGCAQNEDCTSGTCNATTHVCQ